MSNQKHYVTFYSPGSFVSETTKKEIDVWSVDLAIRMAKEIKERYNATPYGFSFQTSESDGWSPKTIKESGMYFLGGKLLTIDDIPNTPENGILRDNMRYNNWDQIIENTNTWKIRLPFHKDKDTVLDWDKNE
jgi:hypothetical protein